MAAHKPRSVGRPVLVLLVMLDTLVAYRPITASIQKELLEAMQDQESKVAAARQRREAEAPDKTRASFSQLTPLQQPREPPHRAAATGSQSHGAATAEFV